MSTPPGPSTPLPRPSVLGSHSLKPCSSSDPQIQSAVGNRLGHVSPVAHTRFVQRERILLAVLAGRCRVRPSRTLRVTPHFDNRGVSAVVGLLAGRWVHSVLARVASDPVRHRELLHAIDGISEKVLRGTLWRMELDG